MADYRSVYSGDEMDKATSQAHESPCSHSVGLSDALNGCSFQIFNAKSGSAINNYNALNINVENIVAAWGLLKNPTGSLIPGGSTNINGQTWSLFIDPIIGLQETHTVATYNNCDITITLLVKNI